MSQTKWSMADIISKVVERKKQNKNNRRKRK